MSEIENKQEKKGSKFLWFIFVFLIPFIFALITTGVVLQFAGIDVIGKVKQVQSNIPFLQEKKQEKAGESSKDLTDKVNELTKALNDSNDKIEQLNSVISTNEKEIEKLKQENETIRAENTSNNEFKAEAEKKRQLILEVYGTMDAKKAALILKEMPENEVELILSKLSSDILSELLANMDPKDAAKYTTMLTN